MSTQPHRRRSVAIVAALPLLLSVMGLVGLAPPADAGAPTGTVTVVHGIPGSVVDVYLDDTLLIEDFEPGDVFGPADLPEGSYDVGVYSADVDPATTPAIIFDTVPVVAGVDASIVASFDTDGFAVLTPFINDVSSIPPGSTRVAFRHAADAGPVDVLFDGGTLASDLAYSTEYKTTVLANTYGIAFADAAGGGVVVNLGLTALPAGSLVSVYVYGSADSSTLAATVHVRDLGAPLVFPDVPPSHPFYGDIIWMADRDLTTGYADGTFRPTEDVTRQAMAAFLYRLKGSPDGFDPACSAAPFPDVPVGHPFCGEIEWLVDAGITTGYADGDFRPTETVTRQAMSAFVYRFVGAPNGPSPACATAPFPDVPVGHPFCGQIDWMVDSNIAEGYDDGEFKPAVELTRQAAAAFLHRTAQVVPTI